MNANDAKLTEITTAQSGSSVEDSAPNAPAQPGFDVVVEAVAGNAIGNSGAPYTLTITAMDLTLVAAAAAGDPHAWDALVERYTALLWSITRSHRLAAADAADVVQTTWLRLVEHLDRISDPERLPGWLATTARREAQRVARRADWPRPGDDFAFLAGDGPAPGNRLLPDG